MDIPPELAWIVFAGFFVAFILSLGIGANDVANTFGTSVGAKVLTLRQACILGSIFETLGAILLGSKVSETIRTGIVDIVPYANQTELLLVGNVATLSGSCLWLATATILKPRLLSDLFYTNLSPSGLAALFVFSLMPVSGTHSIVGASVGFALVAKGTTGIHWKQLGMIFASWITSPLLAGAVSIGIFYICKKFILEKKDPLEPGLRLLPIFYAVIIVINIFSIFFEGPRSLRLDRIPLWATLLLSFGSGCICAAFVRTILVPWQRKKITKEVNSHDTDTKTLSEVNTETSIVETITEQDYDLTQRNGAVLLNASDLDTTKVEVILPPNYAKRARSEARSSIVDRPETVRLFSFLQILTATFGSFAHGGNDVSNSIGPLVGIWLVATTGSVTEEAATPVWILFYGGVGISLGLWIWGRRVIETMGEDLSKVTASSGFCIEIGSALTVLIASNIGLPVSSTHCKVGSIVFTGRLRSRDNVDWSIFRNIILAWVVTVPAAAGFSAAIMAGLRLTVPH